MRSPGKSRRRTTSGGTRRGPTRKPAKIKEHATTEEKQEVEVKLRIPDLRILLRQLKRLRARPIAPRRHETNTLYDTTGGDLARRGEMLRIRIEHPAGPAGTGRKMARGQRRNKGRPGALLTYKGPGEPQDLRRRGSRYKIRAEHELRISDEAAMTRILQALALRPWFRYEKFRSSYSLPGMDGLKLEVDETPIGDFLEIEGEQAGIDRSAALLGFRPDDYITKSYGALFMDYRRMSRSQESGGEPTPGAGLPDMLFSKPK
jgi:adenylate cyclase, class 2